MCDLPGRVAQSVGHLTREQRSWVRYPLWPHTFVSLSADSRGAVVSYWRKYVHEVLVNRLGGLSLPKKSVVRLTDHPDMTLDVYRGRKTTTQQQQIMCDLADFQPTQTNVSNGATTFQGKQLYKIILKSMHKCRSYGLDRLNL